MWVKHEKRANILCNIKFDTLFPFIKYENIIS